MHLQLLLFLLLFLLPDATAGSPCNRQCGSTTVPYPFGFSGGGDCPILLACNSSASAALLPGSTAAGEAYTVHSFNPTASTFLVSLAPSCNRSVSDASAALNGAGYSVSSRTGLFLRGGCAATSGSNNSSSCNVPSGVMSAILRTAQCGVGGNDSSWTCVLSAPPQPGSPAAASGEDEFLRWDEVAAAGCQDALTSAVYADTAQGASIEFGVAEMGWWLDGSCNGTGTAAAGQCATNATCQDVRTPSGAWGHRCACAEGMAGDGFAAGEGCYHDDGGGATSAAGGSWCDRRCGSTAVPYPFGFSGDCPIRLDCNTTASTPLLLTNTTAAAVAAAAYPIVSFNSSTSTFVVSVAPSCSRTVREAQASLAGALYGVSSHTGLFLGHGCQVRNASSSCSVPDNVLTALLQTAQCAGAGAGNQSGGNDTAAWKCVSTPPPAPNSAAAARGEGQFLPWEEVDDAGCEDALTSAVYASTPAGVPSVEFGVAELGWWLNGTCNDNAAVRPCAQNATCHDVQTPSGAWGHRCACMDGMSGDGFAAGEGCYYDVAGSSKKKVFLIAAGVLAGVAAAGVALLLWRLQCRRRHKAGRSASERLAAMRLLSEAATSSGVPVYSYAEIARATNSFSHTHRLGTGAYGTVYVGKLLGSSSASLVAIKRLRCRHHHHHHHDDDDEGAAAEAALLLNEIKLISSVSHPNLVRLLGCCLDRGEQVLVYEYVPNGTLSQHLLSGGTDGRSRLTWRARLGVAAETAAAIAYLHGMRPLPIFHRDVKSSNILLDASLRPKLADFGLSRAVDRLEAARSHVSTAPQGTPGYVDPEYHQNFHLSDKSDVYSFGVVLLELITAMKVVDFDRPPAEVNLASLALDRIGKGRVSEIVDPALLAGNGAEEWVMDSVRLVSELAFRCLAFQKDVRPCMSEVAAELHRIRLAAPDPVDGDGDSEEPGSRLRPVNMMDIQIDVSLDGSDTTAKKKKAASPVSVQEVWVSDQSSPSTNGSMPRFSERKL